MSLLGYEMELRGSIRAEYPHTWHARPSFVAERHPYASTLQQASSKRCSSFSSTRFWPPSSWFSTRAEAELQMLMFGRVPLRQQIMPLPRGLKPRGGLGARIISHAASIFSHVLEKAKYSTTLVRQSCNNTTVSVAVRQTQRLQLLSLSPVSLNKAFICSFYCFLFVSQYVIKAGLHSDAAVSVMSLPGPLTAVQYNISALRRYPHSP